MIIFDLWHNVATFYYRVLFVVVVDYFLSSFNNESDF